MFNISKKNDNKLTFFNDDLFDDFFNNSFFKENTMMKTDLREENDKYFFDIEIPGFNKEDIKISLEDGYLTIEATKQENKDESDKEGNYVRRERYYGNCSRSFYVGNITENMINASYNNGILSISVPKVKEEENRKYISIE